MKSRQVIFLGGIPPTKRNYVKLDHSQRNSSYLATENGWEVDNLNILVKIPIESEKCYWFKTVSVCVLNSLYLVDISKFSKDFQKGE